MIRQDYYQNAKDDEQIFRNILRDLKSNRSKRPGGVYVPENLETEAPLELIFQQYSEGQRMGRFTILNFSRPAQDTAQVAFQDVAPLSGGGAELEYEIKDDSSIEFKKSRGIWKS